MLELGVGADIVRAISTTYWLLWVAAFAWALWKPKTKEGKTISTLLVLVVFLLVPVRSMYQKIQRQKAYQARYEKAKALFDERCKTAGEKIYRTVDNVEGVVLKNTRGTYKHSNYADPAWPGAGFPGESVGNSRVPSSCAFLTLSSWRS